MIKINTTGNTWVELPEPAIGGIGVTDEPIWASNTGRDANNGEMLGDMKCWKTTIEVAWPPLSYSQAKLIRDTIRTAVNNGYTDSNNKTHKGYFRIKYTDIEQGTSLSDMNTTTKTVYCSNIPRLLYSKVYQRYTEVKIKFIEK